ncbi:MAG: efflux RND transporter periplasmic adaptor subunit [Lachnospiraceae bacterium]|nr:efflux RND transporter periplasmic adaptor subunit [Lachnospiraceae bacterium]
MKRLNKTGFLLTASMMAVALGMSGCGKEESETARKELVVETKFPEEGTLTLQNEFMGSITPQEEVYVVPLVNAEVTAAYVSVGDAVQEGDLLCELDDSAAELQVKSASAALSSAKASKDLATGGQAAASNIQAEANIQTIKDNQESLQNKYDALMDGKAKLEEQMDALKDSRKSAKKDYESATQQATAAQEYAASSMEPAAQQALAEAMAAQEKARAVYEATEAAYDQNYPALESQMDSLEQNQKELESSARALGHSLQFAQDSYGLSKGQIADETAAVYQSQMNSAAVGVESAKYQQDLYRLKAPISGIVEAVNVTENSFASSGSAAFVISNKDSMTVTFRVSEDIRNTLRIGEKITVDRNGAVFEASITEIGQMVDIQSGLFVIKGSVRASGNELLTGTSVKITADTYQSTEGVLIPYDAVYYEDGQAYVYVAEEGKAVKTLIEVGLFNDTDASVSSGLTKEDRVIITWSPLLSDGAEIVIKETETEEISGKEADANE